MKEKLIIIFAYTLLGTSCSENFLDRPPLGELTGGTFPATESDAELALNGVYNMLRIWQVSGGYPLLDIMSDDVTKGSNPGDQIQVEAFENFTFDSNEGLIRGWWETLYEGIRKANLVIERLPGIDMEDALKNRMQAEARFLRAYYYSLLLRVWGDVPIKTNSDADPTDIPSRSNADVVWKEVVFPDLDFAIRNLPQKSAYESHDLGRATKGAARSLLAKCYLYTGDFGNAERYALEVINSGQYQLEPLLTEIFTEQSEFGKESIFEIGAIPEVGFGTFEGLGGNQFAITQGVRGKPNKGWGFGRPAYSLIRSFEDGDPRLDAWILFLNEVKDGILIEGDAATPDTTRTATNAISEIECYSEKVWVPGESPAEWSYNRRIIRYADILLVAAEALNENNKSSEALFYLNLVRERARQENSDVLPDIVTTEKEALRNAILEERRFELAFEGQRFWDLVRTNRAAVTLNLLGFVEGKHNVLPIPQSEIDISDGVIIQNEGY